MYSRSRREHRTETRFGSKRHSNPGKRAGQVPSGVSHWPPGFSLFHWWHSTLPPLTCPCTEKLGNHLSRSWSSWYSKYCLRVLLYLEQEGKQTKLSQQMEPRSYLPNFPLGSKGLLKGTGGHMGPGFVRVALIRISGMKSTETWQALDIWGTWSKWWCNLISNYFGHNATFWFFCLKSIWPLPCSVFLCVSACWPVWPPRGAASASCLSMCIVCANMCVGVWWTLPAFWPTSQWIK